MRIYKDELQPMLEIVIKNHKVSRKKAMGIIEDMNNGRLKELTSQVRVKKNKEKKDKTKDFSKQFGKFKHQKK